MARLVEDFRRALEVRRRLNWIMDRRSLKQRAAGTSRQASTPWHLQSINRCPPKHGLVNLRHADDTHKVGGVSGWDTMPDLPGLTGKCPCLNHAEGCSMV